MYHIKADKKLAQNRGSGSKISTTYRVTTSTLEEIQQVKE